MFSALPPEADIRHARWDVRVVPPPDSCTAAKYPFRPLESEVLQDFFRPNLPTQQFCRAGLRPSGRGGGGISRGSIVRPGAALSRPGILFNCVGGHLLEPILTQTAHFLVPLQRLKSLNHHPQWRVGNFGENCHAETIHYTRCGQKPCALTTRRSRSVRSLRLVAGRCSEQFSTKRAAHRIRMG